MSLADLPPPDTRRWVVRRKALVVCAVRGRLLTVDEACSRYGLSLDEYLRWQALSASHGMMGLRTTKTQVYRQSEKQNEPSLAWLPAAPKPNG